MSDIPYSQKWQDEQALFRFQTISPLLDTELDAKKKNTLRQQIAQDKDISIRTLYRWEKLHAVGGFSALKPANRAQRRSAKLPTNFSEVLQQAILLKREVPLRSVEQIIYILEGEGWVGHGELKRSTLQRYLYNAGYGKKQMKKYSEAKYSSSQRRLPARALSCRVTSFTIGIISKRQMVRDSEWDAVSRLKPEHSPHFQR